MTDEQFRSVLIHLRIIIAILGFVAGNVGAALPISLPHPLHAFARRIFIAAAGVAVRRVRWDAAALANLARADLPWTIGRPVFCTSLNSAPAASLPGLLYLSACCSWVTAFRRGML